MLNQIHVATVAASKAVRIVAAAGGRSVIDFGSRRAHGIDAAMKVARASYLRRGGDVAGRCRRAVRHSCVGTMAHSYIQAHRDEAEAFEAFTRLYPETTLLVDTYYALSGVRSCRTGPPGGLSFACGQFGSIRAIWVSLRSRRERCWTLPGCSVQIFASSELDEFEIEKLLASGGPIDGFGVGTKDGSGRRCAASGRGLQAGRIRWPRLHEAFVAEDPLSGAKAGLSGGAPTGSRATLSAVTTNNCRARGCLCR